MQINVAELLSSCRGVSLRRGGGEGPAKGKYIRQHKRVGEPTGAQRARGTRADQKPSAKVRRLTSRN